MPCPLLTWTGIWWNVLRTRQQIEDGRIWYTCDFLYLLMLFVGSMEHKLNSMDWGEACMPSTLNWSKKLEPDENGLKWFQWWKGLGSWSQAHHLHVVWSNTSQIELWIILARHQQGRHWLQSWWFFVGCFYESLNKLCSMLLASWKDPSFMCFQVGNPTPAADSGLPVWEPGGRKFHSRKVHWFSCLKITVDSIALRNKET